jgi:NAD(P)-dependent dehydrogenase (short-subunit alcohol dehydrogenase family)
MNDTLIPEWVPPPVYEGMSGRVAIVSGAGSSGPGIGNGRATAILLARAGAHVGVLDFDADAAAETEAMIASIGGEATAVRCDVADAAACETAVERVVERYGRLDALVNNVGIDGAPGKAEDVDLEEWDRGLRINVTSMMHMARYSVGHMRTAGGGSIVNIGSQSGLLGGYPHLLYPTTKGAVTNMTRAMAAHYGPDQIRVNCVAPGKIYTPKMVASGVNDEMRRHRRLQSVLQTEGTAWDVGLAVTFLAGDAARWITGVVLPVDAGASATQWAGAAAWPT